MEILNVQSLTGTETVGIWKTWFLGWCWNYVYLTDVTTVNKQKCEKLKIWKFFENSIHPPFVGKKLPQWMAFSFAVWIRVELFPLCKWSDVTFFFCSDVVGFAVPCEGQLSGYKNWILEVIPKNIMEKNLVFFLCINCIESEDAGSLLWGWFFFFPFFVCLFRVEVILCRVLLWEIPTLQAESSFTVT